MAWDPPSDRPQTTLNVQLMAWTRIGPRPKPKLIIQWPEHDEFTPKRIHSKTTQRQNIKLTDKTLYTKMCTEK